MHDIAEAAAKYFPGHDIRVPAYIGRQGAWSVAGMVMFLQMSAEKNADGQYVYSARDIAERVGGLSRSAVIGLAHRMNLPPRADSIAVRTPRAPRNPRPSVPQPPPLPDLEVFNAAIPHQQRRSLLELGPGMCRYMVGDVGEEGSFFCAGPQRQGSPWCETHHRHCHRPAGNGHSESTIELMRRARPRRLGKTEFRQYGLLEEAA